MKLYNFKISGFKKIKEASVFFGDATFLIGPNNCGKSSILEALNVILSDRKSLDSSFFYSIAQDESKNPELGVSEIVLEVEFRDVPNESMNWRGFKGRILSYDVGSENETGKRIFYKKTYKLDKPCEIAIKSLKRTLKSEYKDVTNINDFIEKGLDKEELETIFGNIGADKKFSKPDKEKFEMLDCIWDLDQEKEEWIPNPGGISTIVLSKLPHYLLIPANIDYEEISSPKGSLQKILTELFREVRESSENYKSAQQYLIALSRELNPDDKNSQFGVMMNDLNRVLDGVFPDTKFFASANLSGPENLTPSFDIFMSSNIKTSVSCQGTGMVRAAIFALLKFRQERYLQGKGGRKLLIGFEEPEIYLHPSAANQMRDTIYSLAQSSAQIIATTHSPYLIDISRNPRQILNRVSSCNNSSQVYPFSISDKFLELQEDDKQYVKMLAKIDDYLARIFFTHRVIIVEGDTEEVVLREALNRLTPKAKATVYSKVEIIKARGKATIIGILKYIRALKIDFFVIHDRDNHTPGAAKFNAPIEVAAGDPSRIFQMEECIEDFLGYDAPSSEKPFNAYKKTTSWGRKWTDVPSNLRNLLSRATGINLDILNDSDESSIINPASS